MLSLTRKGPLLGNFEENILNKRLEPIRTVEDYSIEVRAIGHFEARPMSSRVQVSFFSAGFNSFPYFGQMEIGKRGYRIPKDGTLQVTLFNPLGKVENLFILLYDLSDMPPNSQTFLRQRTILTSDSGSPVSAEQESMIVCLSDHKQYSLRYLLQINIVSSKSGRIYLNKDVKIFVSKNVDLETALQLTEKKFELKSYNEMPNNPRYFTR